jgi:fructose 1,6-bisphosphate aldolase/phosphatase
MPLMPVRLKSPVSYFDGPPVVSCAAFSVHNGRLTRPVDAFDHPFWDTVRGHVADKAMDMRKQGFFGAAMQSMAELEYTGIVERLRVIEKRFSVRKPQTVRAA